MQSSRTNSRPAAARAAVSRKVWLRSAAFAVIFLLMTARVVVAVSQGGVTMGWVIGGFGVGLMIGVLLARTLPLSLNADHEVVVSRLTLLGAVVLAAHLIISLFGRDDLLTALIQDDHTASVTALAITGGVMLGRLLVQVRQIRRLLVDSDVLPGPREAPGPSAPVA